MSVETPKTLPSVTIKPDGGATHDGFESPVGTVLAGELSPQMLQTMQELATKNGTSVAIEIAKFWAAH